MSLSQNPMTRQDGYIRRPPPGTCPPPVSQARPLTHTRATPSCATPTPPSPPPTCQSAAPVISPTLTWSIPLFPLGCPAPLADGCGSGLAGGRRGGLGGGCASCLVASPPPSHPGTGPAPPGAPPFDRHVAQRHESVMHWHPPRSPRCYTWSARPGGGAPPDPPHRYVALHARCARPGPNSSRDGAQAPRRSAHRRSFPPLNRGACERLLGPCGWLSGTVGPFHGETPVPPPFPLFWSAAPPALGVTTEPAPGFVRTPLNHRGVPGFTRRPIAATHAVPGSARSAHGPESAHGSLPQRGVAWEPEGRCLPRLASQPEERCLRCLCTHVVERVGVVIGRVRVGPHARVSALHRGACTLVRLPGDIRLRRWIAWRRARFKLHVRIVATKARRKGCLA